MNQDLVLVAHKLDEINAQLTFLTERQRRQEERLSETVAEATTLARVAMTAVTERLDTLERDGTFDKGRELLEVGRQALAGFSAQDVRELGSSIVSILDAVRALTQPAVLAIATDAAAALEQAGDVKPIGIFGMVKASRNDDVQKGMAIMLDVLRRIGHAATAASTKQRELDGKKAQLAAVLGSRRGKILGTERPKALPAGAPSRRAARPAQVTASAPAAGVACGTPAAAQPTAVVLDGVAYGADGHLTDPAAWTRALAEGMASLQGLTLTEAHWRLIDAARAEFAAQGVSPNIRRLTEVAGVTTKEIYQLFPKAPGRTLAKVAGLPKPAGCL